MFQIPHHVQRTDKVVTLIAIENWEDQNSQQQHKIVEYLSLDAVGYHLHARLSSYFALNLIFNSFTQNCVKNSIVEKPIKMFMTQRTHTRTSFLMHILIYILS